MSREIPEKSFSVVFTRTTPMLEEDNEHDFNYSYPYRRRQARKITQQASDFIKVSHKDYTYPQSSSKTTPINDAKFAKILTAIENSATQEIRATDQFVQDIEAMMDCVNNNMKKLQSTFENILKKLPRGDSNPQIS